MNSSPLRGNPAQRLKRTWDFRDILRPDEDEDEEGPDETDDSEMEDAAHEVFDVLPEPNLPDTDPR